MEDEIKVGEYVRLDDGTIGKYQINKNWINVVETNDKYIGFDIEKEIVNHSFNIIDLIEANDYVNGRKVQQVFTDPFTKKKRLLIEGTEVNWQGDMSSIYCEADEIKSIVTHQQFKSIEYTIHEREEKENA